MNSELEHSKCAEELGAYALGALPDAESDRVRRHLSGCRECRAELEWLRAAVDALPVSVTPIEPPPELKARLMETVSAEAELLRASGAEADRPRPAPRRRWRLPAPRIALPGLAFAAASAAVVVVVAIVLAGTGTSTRTIQAQIADPALAGRVSASLHVRGAHAELAVRGLPAPAAGHVDELWVQRPGSAPRPAGTFVLQSGSVVVGRAVRSGDRVMVTVEPGRGTSAPTTAPLMVVKA